jgi:hypothetical protein
MRGRACICLAYSISAHLQPLEVLLINMMYSACFAGVRILWRECSGCDAVAHDCCVRLGHDLCMLCMLYCCILACIARCADDSIDQCVLCVCGTALLLYQKQARTVVSNV